MVAMYYALEYLLKPDRDTDRKSAIAMELGALFCLLTTVTGMIFSKAIWGQWWNWDPSQTRILVMMLLYLSYPVLRAATNEQPDKQGKLSAVYVLLTIIPATFLIWVVPRITAGLHPTEVLQRPKNTSAGYKAVLYPSLIAFQMLYVWLFQLRLRVWRVRDSVNAI